LILGRSSFYVTLVIFFGGSVLVGLGVSAAFFFAFPAVLFPIRFLPRPTPTPVPGIMTKIAIYATDPQDQYLRDWGLTIDRPMPPEQDGSGYVGADGYENLYSGYTMTVLKTLSLGPHYLIFVVGQSGGPSYGTYSGTITINGHVYEFGGVDVANSVRIDFYT
jgi:hypothetical protein